MTETIAIAQSDEEIAMCFAVLAELRPHLEEAAFVTTINGLAVRTGFALAYLKDGEVKAVAGYRISEWLHMGKYLEIEDLVTASTARSMGYGGRLFDWLVAEARRQGCRQLRLVSGVRRAEAHKFYARKGMVHEAQYFSLTL